MQLGRGLQYSLVTFYNPEPATMASFMALAHVEQSVRAREKPVCGLRAPGSDTPRAKRGAWDPWRVSCEPRLCRASRQDVRAAVRTADSSGVSWQTKGSSNGRLSRLAGRT